MSVENVTVTVADEVTVVSTAAAGPRGPAGADGADATYSDTTPQALGTPDAGSTDEAARADHVHAMPSAADVGADPTGTASTAVSSHAAAVDPHGDRAYADALVDDLSGVTNASTARSNLGLGTAALAATGDFDAAGTAAARTLVGTLASRPSAAALANGVRYLATDDAGGTLWVVSSGAWVQAAPPVAAPMSLLALAELGSTATINVAATSTDYRITALSTSFVVPTGRRCLVEIGGGLRIYKSGDADISPQVSIRYSTNAWSSSSSLTSVYGPLTPGLLFGTELNDMPAISGLLPSSVAAGTTVAVGVWLRDTTDTGDHVIHYDATNGLRPFISVKAL